MEMNRPKAPASETLQTADLDNRGILQLQDQSMRQQDAELEELERTVTSTKVLPLPSLNLLERYVCTATPSCLVHIVQCRYPEFLRRARPFLPGPVAWVLLNT